MADPIISICVPTYNRKKKLKRLLGSIKSDHECKVEVVIVDDGSSDNTSDYCRRLITDFRLVLIQQKNQGRSSALSGAIKNASGKFIIIMDSDDRFVERAIDDVLETIAKYEHIVSDPKICGFVFTCVDENNNILGNNFKKNGVNNFLRYRADERVRGDKKEVVKSSLLKSVLYRPFDGEPRMPTSIMWNRLARKYDVYTLRSPLVVKEYLEGGMTKKSQELRLMSIRSTLLYYEECLSDFGIQYKSLSYGIRIAANYTRYCWHDRSFTLRPLLNLTIPQMVVLLLSVPTGTLLFLNDILGIRKISQSF